MKKGLNFTKSQLEELYIKKKLSLIQIGNKFNCYESNILYWLKKFKIQRRPARNPNSVYISKGILEDLYWNKKMSSLTIAKKFSLNDRTIRKKLKKLNIPRRTLSEAGTRKKKEKFNSNLIEKAFLLGLRAGDFHAKRVKLCVRVQTTSTHLAQIDLLRNAFSKYGEICTYLSKHKDRADEWFIYVDLDKSFDFLVEKPKSIPNWIIENDEYFWQFFAAYIDCEGNWHLSRSHQVHSKFSLRLRTGDKRILEDMKRKLLLEGFNPLFILEIVKGSPGPSGKFHSNIYNLSISRKQEVLLLIKKILDLSMHSEKIRKMKLMLTYGDENYALISKKWKSLKEEIEGEILKNI